MTPADFDIWLRNPARRPLLMGVLNVTPDSFSDGGKFAAVEAAIARAREMIEQGASVIDIGGESTRPGADRVPASEQIDRIVRVVTAIRNLPCVISIDTTDSAVAVAALDAGATMLNDVTAGRDDPQMVHLAAARQVPIALMHSRGDPKTMQSMTSYEDVVSEVEAFLVDRARAAIDAGVAPHLVLIDVGIGFAKTHEQNLALLRHHDRIARHGYATVLGTSRKGFIGQLTGVKRPEDRAFGTAATVAWGVAHGAQLLRVHDVEAMRQVIAITSAIRDA